ncbi:MAG: hypothetical protein JXR10_08405 [Cyclobacteriaceae bacterium]
MNENEQIQSILDVNDIKIHEGKGFLSLKKKGSSRVKMYFVSLVAGIALIFFALVSPIGESFVFVGLLIIVLPLLTQRWKDPHEILIEERSSLTLNSGITISRKILLADVLSLEVDEAVINSDASPFKSGYQDFIYSFNLITSQKTRTLFSLTFRNQNTADVEMVFKFLSAKLGLAKAQAT